MSTGGEEVKFIGVRKRKWVKHVAEIRSGKRSRISLGSYFTAEAAARAYDTALLCLRGPNATSFNFPDTKMKSSTSWDVVNSQGNPSSPAAVRRAAIAVGSAFDRVPQIDGHEEGGPSSTEKTVTNVEEAARAETSFQYSEGREVSEEEENDAARLLMSPEHEPFEESVQMAPLQPDTQVSIQPYDQSDLFHYYTTWNTSRWQAP